MNDRIGKSVWRYSEVGQGADGARFVEKIYVFQTASHANCESEYDIYHIRGLYSGLTVIHFMNRLCMLDRAHYFILSFML